jgi:hypothetical protein
MRKVTSGDFPGCATMRICADAEEAKRKRQAMCAIDVGQVGNLRGGWLPPPVRCERGGTLWVGPIDNRPQLNKLPHKVSASL